MASPLMTWKEIREKFPDTFVLLDNCVEKQIDEVHSEILGGDVIFSTQDGKRIFEEYRKRGKTAHMAFAHTRWPKLQVELTSMPGLRIRHV